MARNDDVACAADAWTQLTAGDATAITFQNKGPGVLEIRSTVGAVAPTDFTGALRYQVGEGEINMLLSDMNPGLAGTRVYAYAAGSPCKVSVSHA